MRLFKSDLYRSFAIGFVAGAIAICVILGIQNGNGVSGNVVPAAVAAPTR